MFLDVAVEPRGGGAASAFNAPPRVALLPRDAVGDLFDVCNEPAPRFLCFLLCLGLLRGDSKNLVDEFCFQSRHAHKILGGGGAVNTKVITN